MMTYEQFKERYHFDQTFNVDQLRELDSYVSVNIGPMADWMEMDEVMEDILNGMREWRRFFYGQLFLVCEEAIERKKYGPPSERRKREIKRKERDKERFIRTIQDVRNSIQQLNEKGLGLSDVEKTKLIELLARIAEKQRRAISQTKSTKRLGQVYVAAPKEKEEYYGKFVTDPGTALAVFMLSVFRESHGGITEYDVRIVGRLFRFWRFDVEMKLDDSDYDVGERLRQRFKAYSDSIELIPTFNKESRVPEVLILMS